MTEFSEERRHEPTASRLREAQAAGQIAISTQLTSALIWLAGVAVLLSAGNGCYVVLRNYVQNTWSDADISVPLRDSSEAAIGESVVVFSKIVLPGLILVAVIGLLCHWFQVGMRVFPQRVRIDWGRVIPNSRRVFAWENLSRCALGGLQLISMTAIAIYVLASDADQVLRLSLMDLQSAAPAASQYLSGLAVKLFLVAALLAVFDYGIRNWLMRRRLRMTDQELREDLRNSQPAQEVAARHRLSWNAPHDADRARPER